MANAAIKMAINHQTEMYFAESDEAGSGSSQTATCGFCAVVRPTAELFPSCFDIVSGCFGGSTSSFTGSLRQSSPTPLVAQTRYLVVPRLQFREPVSQRFDRQVCSSPSHSGHTHTIDNSVSVFPQL